MLVTKIQKSWEILQFDLDSIVLALFLSNRPGDSVFLSLGTLSFASWQGFTAMVLGHKTQNLPSPFPRMSFLIMVISQNLIYLKVGKKSFFLQN